MKILEDLKRLSKEATSVPWNVHFETGIGPFIVGAERNILSINTNGRDLVLIAEMRNNIDALIAVVEAAGKIGCLKMGGGCCMNGFSELKEAFAKLEDDNGKD